MTSSSPALVGLSMDATADFRAQPTAKNAALFAALDRRYGVATVIRPEVSALCLRGHQLRHAHPDRDLWRRRVNLDPRLMQARSAVAERLLAPHRGRLIMQLHTLVGPGTQPGSYPFVLHTDTTYALTERYFPAGAPLRGRARARWLAQEQRIYQAAAFLFPRSAWLRQSFITDYGCDPARVILTGAGANLPICPPEVLSPARWAAPTALFVGVDFPRKGGEGLLRAWRQVRRTIPQARLQIVGVSQRPAGLPTGVEWLGTIADRAVLMGLYDAARVFVMPSIYEPWGHVFYEAMSRGAACIGADTCAMPEILEHGAAGVLVPPGDDGALADALVRLLGDAGEAERLGRAGHAAARRHGSWDDVVTRMAPSIEAALAG